MSSCVKWSDLPSGPQKPLSRVAFAMKCIECTFLSILVINRFSLIQQPF